MPIFDFGAALGGLAQGLRQGQQMRQAGQELELRRKMLDIQMKQMEFDQKRKQEEAEVKRQERLMNETVAGAMESSLTGGQPAVQGYEDVQAQMSRAPVPAQPGPTPLDWKGQAMVGAARTGKIPYTEVFKEANGPADMSEYQRQSLDLQRQRLETPREGVGVEAQTWSKIVRENPGADVATLREIYNKEINKTAGQRAGGAETGRMGVRSTPAFQQTEEDVARKRAEGTTAGRPLGEAAQGQGAMLESLLQTTLPTIRKNFSQEYLGPIKGTDIAFETRRRIGSAIKSPVGEQETQFRLALTDAGDILLRARSGAQINEQEYGRLKGILPKPTDEPNVFNAALNRFENELRSIMQAKIKMGTTPRGQLGIPSPPAGWRQR